MNGTSHGWAILALLLTSLLVRVFPAFVKLRLSASARALLEQVLPLAVFLNFAVYIAIVELKQAPWPAAAAFVLCALISFSTRSSLIFNTLVGTGLWFSVFQFLLV